MKAPKDFEEMLAEEAAALEAEENTPAEEYTYERRSTPAEPSQVYSVRIPVNRLRQLRQLADLEDVQPSTMMRGWVLERLAKEYLEKVGTCPTCGKSQAVGSPKPH